MCYVNSAAYKVLTNPINQISHDDAICILKSSKEIEKELIKKVTDLYGESINTYSFIIYSATITYIKVSSEDDKIILERKLKIVDLLQKANNETSNY